ncbi:adaptor protein MecA [Streptococcus sp. HF-100]|uniref:adaptor protein MecA n=1 Tax=Streptococcus sp. HF-100 TaxID=2785791 RepID=UPI0018A09DA2|nr:adaptor protein MecA [Streptococcus sp. HF-100]MBF7076478.1 adaptor protein MecA [Streptococcus sp. HF-100]
MEMKQISDTTIKITIKLEDLEERGMEMADFLVPQEKTEEFFYAILDELEMPESFLDSGMLSFRVTPKPDRLDVFVTKSKIDKNLNFDDLADLPDVEELSQMSPDEFLKALEKNIFEKSKDDMEAVRSLETAEADDNTSTSDMESEENSDELTQKYIYYILKFSSLKEAIVFSKTVDYAVNTSELYKMDDHYYLTILVDIEGRPKRYPAWLLALMREHAEDTDVTRAVLQEHGYLLLVNEAVASLKKVKCL